MSTRPEGQLKRKLRQLKKLEIALRYGKLPPSAKPPLIWDEFFSTRAGESSVKYPFEQLLRLDREQLKAIFEEYFYQVYFQRYAERGLKPEDVYDPKLLSLLGLPPQAGLADIKKRFRELAKKHHPDHGGDSAQFIRLMETYEKLTE
jgi:hypothetical protein